MIGNTNHMTAIDSEKSMPADYTFLYNSGSTVTTVALPLIALQYHDVRMTLKFRDSHSCINGDDSVLPQMKDANLLIDYIYLDTEERKDSHKLNMNTSLNNYNSLVPNLFLPKTTNTD